MWVNLIQSMWSEMMMMVTFDSIRFATKSVRRTGSPTGWVQERDDTIYQILFELPGGPCGSIEER